MSPVHGMLQGALAMGTFVIAVIFLRYWRDGGDRFFLYFALSFLVQEGTPWQYGVRLLAYLLILVAIIDKNRPPGRPAAT